MMRKMQAMLFLAAVVGLASFATAEEPYSTDFTSYWVDWPGFAFQDTGVWWGPVGTTASGYSTVCQACGVGGSAGITAGPKNYHWIEHPFEWEDPTIAGVVISMDFETPATTNTSFPFTKDRVGWTVNPYGTDESEFFQVSLSKASPFTNPPTGMASIEGAWSASIGGSTKSPVICTYNTTGMTGNTFYRLRMAVTKLNSNYRTPVRIDVTVTQVNADGTLGTQFASGSINDTSALPGSEIPSPALFTATAYMTERNPNGSAKGDTDNAYLEVVRIETPDCLSSVTPYDDVVRSADAIINESADPSSFEYDVNNLGLNSLSYTVTELDDQLAEADVAWLSVDKPNGTVAASASDTVTANINTAGLTQGTYHAYLKFTDSCTPPLEHIRRINLTVYGCTWSVDSCSQERSYSLDYPTAMPQDVVYRVTNTGEYPINYSVAKTGDTLGWLNVTNPTGTVAAGQYVDVVSQIIPGVIASSDDYNCTLTFDDDCSPQTVTRNIRLRYLTTGNTHVFSYNGDVDPDTDGSIGPGMRFHLYETVPNGLVEDDVDAIDGKVWRMIDFGTMKSRYRAQYWNDADWSTIPIHGEGGNTMVARLKVTSWNGSTREPWIAIDHGDSSSAEFIWGGNDGMAGENKRDIEEQTTLPSSDFVTLWMSSKGEQDADEWKCGRRVDLYVMNDDQEILWQKHITSASAADSDREGFFFGDNSTAGMMDVSFDWITGTNAGAFAPGEEVAVLGRSLFLSRACVILFPDADQDSDVDMVDFAAFQRCYSPTVEVSADCLCYDRDHSGKIDEDDLMAFLACAGGPNVFFDPDSPPADCHP
jgi:hypothetical protein